MDELTQFNQERWNALVEAGIQYGQPLLDLTPDSARTMVDDCGVMAPVGGKDVLCLASGGGQQSPAFALLGARVTVVDFAEKQLAQDALALAHYGLTGRLEQGDMRDLSRFADN
ncbi:MAG: class I SAM-dependent methyltransferase, partial [Anaerolineales bacterium]|nr:class I SAM-dependent methyltransferase [Anaerolineales bacterium]